MTLEEMKARKRELGYTNQMIAQKAQLPLGTVQKIFSGITKAPRRETVLALEKLLALPGKEGRIPLRGEAGSRAAVREEMQYDAGYDNAAPAYTQAQPQRSSQLASPLQPMQLSSSPVRPPHKYTLDDYYALPDDRRVELIDGVFYDMASPTDLHQAILGQLYLQFTACMDNHPECEVFFAPLDVRLHSDNYTMVQPDLMIICNRADHDRRRINGAPDFVIEILSPSSRAHDLYRKLAEYARAGVREYWVVDPERLKIIVYDLEHDGIPVLYGFEDTVPVGISGGECRIDFARVYEKVKRYLEEDDGE